MSSSFINLHTHSHYSLLNALPKIKDLVARAKELEMDALALTDQGNLYGAIEFYKECVGADIKPILGAEVYIAPLGLAEEERNREHPYELVLLVKNKDGYENLVKLVTESYLEGEAGKPRLSNETLQKHADGLIVLSGGTNSEIVMALKNNDFEKAKELTRFYQDTFGKENFYLEITHHPTLPGHTNAMQQLVRLSEETGAPLVAAQDSSYLYPDDKMAYNALRAVQGGRDQKSSTEDLSFITPEKAQELFADFPDAIHNTREIADKCEISFEFGNWFFPKADIEENSTAEDTLRKLTYEGIEKRGMEKTQEVVDRIEYELGIICTKGYAPYFLIVGDLLDHAHQNDILTSIRGSVAGSLVTYLLGITHLDPLEYRLAFERFLNPDRPSAPDIDMDFADNRRDEMLEYARRKHGYDRVAQIGTFGTMAARGAVRDIARALGYPYAIGDKIARMIPFGAQGFPMTIDRALEEVPELKELYENEDEAEDIIDMAKKVEGCARHISIHAAGVVIAPEELTKFTPLQHDPKGGKIITQYDMHAVEDAGLPKFDFLGIRNLAILANAIRLVKEFYGEDVDIEDIPLDDPKTFDMLARGETVGLFQLNGTGMTHYLMELKPNTIHDINAMVALYRPGPMEFIPEYIRRKKDPSLVDFPHPDLEEDLQLSYGLLIYQEDVMISAIKLANYSWLDADKFRKAMGKKIPELMDEQEQKFKSGCMENGMEKKNVDQLWENIKPFASYAFNKAHSASYGRVAYQTSYMKANYPAPYMTAILSAESGDTEKVAEIVAECKRMGIPVLAPDVNESEGDFTVIQEEKGKNDNSSIRFGLYTIKNLGSAISDAIVDERKERGAFESFENFLERVEHKDLNRKSLEALIMSGAMDTLGERGQMLENLEDALLYLKEKNSEATKNQGSLFGGTDVATSMSAFTMKPGGPATADQKLTWEKQLLGLYVSGHPLDKFKEKLQEKKALIGFVKENAKKNTEVTMGGLLHEVKPIMTKKGDRMAFLKLTDQDESMELVIFPKAFEKYKDLLIPDTCVAVRGKYSERNGEISMIVDKLKQLT